MIRQEEAMWRWFLGLSAVPGAMVLVAYRLLPESPRYLSAVGRHDEAVKVRGSLPFVSGCFNFLTSCCGSRLSYLLGYYVPALFNLHLCLAFGRMA